ncbi:MAG: DUF3501 family protein [Dongiaceae bacterium]
MTALAKRRSIARADLMPLEEYKAIRKERRAEIVARKRSRRMEIGPVATFHFENFETMWLQIQEMLYIEKGGVAQIDDELAAYGPMIPNGRELVATVLFEIDEPTRRKAFLSRLGGIEETAFIRVGGEIIKAVPETDVDRTTADGKASSVQFLHFPFTDAQVASFVKPGAEVVIGFSHPVYGHMSIMPESVRAALAEDFD